MKTMTLTVAVVLSLAASAWAQTKATTVSSPKIATGKKPVPAMQPVTDDPKLPRVLLIGDSISIGYTVPVQELLQGKANVHRIHANGGPTTNGLANLQKWLGDGRWDVIHFNWGLHDLKWVSESGQMIPPAAYEKNLRELVRRLKATGAKLIWATTTPVPEEKQVPERKATDALVYNAIAKKIMEENGVAVDDLYVFILPDLAKWQLPANVHFTPEGYQQLAKPVAASIESVLNHK